MSRSAAAAVPSSLWSELPTDLDASVLGGSSLAAPSSPSSEPPLAWVWATAGRWVALARSLTLATLVAGSGAVAAAGLALLLFLAVTAGLAPPRDTFTRPLALDFSQADLVAQAVFLPEAQAAGYDGLPPADPQSGVRFLAPGQAVDVWVELEVPRGTEQGVAQVVAQLSSLDGQLAAKASRAVLLRTDWWCLRSMALAPLRWLGLGGDVRRVRVPLFAGYREKRGVPFMAATVSIKTRNPHWAAEVVSATLKVRLRLGLLRRCLYSLRPAALPLVLLGCTGVALLLGGGTGALLFLGLLVWASARGGSGGPPEEASQGASSSVSEAEAEQVSSASGVSEASSSLLREVEAEEAAPPSPHPAASAAAAKVQQWYDSLPSTSAAGAAGGRTAGPADSAMGSNGGGGRAQAAAALRRRPGGAKPAPP